MAPVLNPNTHCTNKGGWGNVFHAFDGRAITPFSQDAVNTASRGTTRPNFGDVEQGSLNPTAIITSPEAGPEKDAVGSHEVPFPLNPLPYPHTRAHQPALAIFARHPGC
jgi:hypothetical protein